MKLGDKIKLHYEKKGLFKDSEPEIVDGEFTIISVSYGLPHCFSEDSSNGFNSFDYAEPQEGRPDIVRLGSIYVPTPEYLDKQVVKDLNYDKKMISWEILEAKTELSDLVATDKESK